MQQTGASGAAAQWREQSHSRCPPTPSGRLPADFAVHPCVEWQHGMGFSSERLTSRPFVAAAAMGAARGLTFSKRVYGVSNPYDQAWCDSRAGRLAPPFLGGPMGAPLACSGCCEQELQASGAIRRAISLSAGTAVPQSRRCRCFASCVCICTGCGEKETGRS